MATTFNSRNLIDAQAQVTRTLPAAAASNTSTGIYIGGDGPHKERLKLKVELPTNSVLVATKTLTIALWDSADNSSFAAASPAQSFVITGATGFAAQDIYFEIAQTTRDYVAARFTVESGGGDNTATTATISVVS
ncbi:MAG: hypothetical protein EBX95_07700 [Acidimicrobiia bacterium]|nr:hypothetical protein [Acidimicrobiia bacterium]